MFKNFHGFSLLKNHHEEKQQRRAANENLRLVKTIKLLVVTLITLTLWALPAEAFGIEGLTAVEQRIIAIFAFATLMWILEAVPAWTTSVVVVVLLLLATSDSSLWFLRTTDNAAGLGQLVKYKSIMQCFADPIIMLFIGGFILAIAATKSGLDVTLARTMLRPFGTQSRYVLLGFLLVTAVFSMFISNTATAALLVPILAIAGTSMKSRLVPLGGVKPLLIGVALSSSLAMMLPISTPPNALAQATGLIRQRDMEKVGVIIGGVGLLLGYLMLIVLGSNGLL